MKSQYMDVVRRAGRWTLLFILAMGLSTAPERAEAAGKYKKKGEVQVRAKKTKITTLRRSTKARREVRHDARWRWRPQHGKGRPTRF